MHTLVAHKGPNVQAILRDFASEGNFFDVATMLTLYKIFDKLNWVNARVPTNEWVNGLDEKFEHRCPVGWILSRIFSHHNNYAEDRVWQFTCQKKDWIQQ